MNEENKKSVGYIFFYFSFWTMKTEISFIQNDTFTSQHKNKTAKNIIR